MASFSFSQNSETPHWDVTGDDGFSRSSLNLLRCMTILFFAVTLCALTLITGVFDLLNSTMKLQTLRIVIGVISVFAAFGLWIAIQTHPLSRPLPKGLKMLVLIGYFYWTAQSFDFLPWPDVNPLFILYGVPLILGALVLIPVTQAAWTAKPRLTND